MKHEGVFCAVGASGLILLIVQLLAGGVGMGVELKLCVGRRRFSDALYVRAAFR